MARPRRNAASSAWPANFYQRQPKLGSDGNLYCVETNSLDLHMFDLTNFAWDFVDRKYIGW